MALEDDFCDIVKKARVGQSLSVESLAKAAHVAVADVSAFEAGRRSPTPQEAAAIARALGLRAEPLSLIAEGRWQPASVAPAQVQTILGDIGGYAVKGYVLHDGGQAIVIDTAYNAGAMLHALDRVGAQLTAVCLTHGHADHADGLEEILDRWPVPVYLGTDDERLLSWAPPKAVLQVPTDGDGLRVGGLSVRFLATPGHTPGGTCYLVEQVEPLLCFVGDTLFAGSIGRSNPSSLYPTHLESVRRRVLALPPTTVLLPGHGPATTVGEERAHNPFGDGGT